MMHHRSPNATADHNVREKSRGRIHGQQDATARLHPIYIKPKDAYASGYMSGYSSYCPSQQPRVSQPVEWSVTYNQKWGWYEVWVSNRWIGRADSHDEAERVATKRIALDEMILGQNQAVRRVLAHPEGEDAGRYDASTLTS